MSSQAKAVLSRGPDELAEQIVSIDPQESELKVPFRNGYEHFKLTSRRQETTEGSLPVYEWWERTELPG
jgi:hypothetical protein